MNSSGVVTLYCPHRGHHIDNVGPDDSAADPLCRGLARQIIPWAYPCPTRDLLRGGHSGGFRIKKQHGFAKITCTGRL